MFVCQRCRVLRWDLAPAPTSKTQHRTLTPPNAASGRQAASHLLHAAGALSRQKGRASGQSRDVCAPACRWAAHATERGPVAPPVAFSALPTPPIAASGRQPPLTRGRRPLAAKGSSERAESRDVCAPACRWAAHATERGPVAPPVAFRTPHATNCRLRAPATSYTRPAPSRGKRVERAGRVAMSLRTWVFAAYMLYPVPRRTHFDNQNLPQNLRPPLEIC